jgi:hypothetical protein
MTTPVAAPLAGRIELDTNDSDRAIDHLNQAYRTSLRVSGAQDGYRFRHVRADRGSCALDGQSTSCTSVETASTRDAVRSDRWDRVSLEHERLPRCGSESARCRSAQGALARWSLSR